MIDQNREELEQYKDELQQATDELTVLNETVRKYKKIFNEAKSELADAEKETKVELKKAFAKAKANLDTVVDKRNNKQDEVDTLEGNVFDAEKELKSKQRKGDTIKNVVAAMEDRNAYYIASKSKWYGVYANSDRYRVETAEWSNEQMKDLILAKTGWVETSDLSVKKIAQEHKRMFCDVERNFSPTNENVLNQFDELKKFWLKPIFGKGHHEAFDVLLDNICDGEPDYVEHLERYFAYRYVNPEDIFVPNIDSCATGGTGRDTLFHIIERIFTSECCGEATTETFSGTHNGELWGKVWIKISERNSKAIEYEQFKNLTGGHTFRLRKMNENARQADRTFVFMIYNNGYHSTIPVTGNGKSSEDRRVEPIFSKTNLVERIQKHYTKDDFIVDEKLAVELLVEFQDNVYNNDEEIAKWLGYIIEKHKPQEIKKFEPLHGKFYQMKISRQKNAFNEFMDIVKSLSQSTTCYSIDEMYKIFKLVSGTTITKNSFAKNMCEWLIKDSKDNWVSKLANVYLDGANGLRRKKNVVIRDVPKVSGSNKNKDIFDIFDFINQNVLDDKGKDLGRKPHALNIKDELL